MRIVQKYTLGDPCRRVQVLNREDPELSQIYGAVEYITEELEDGTRYAVLHHSGGETSTFPTAEWRIRVETFVDIW